MRDNEIKEGLMTIVAELLAVVIQVGMVVLVVYGIIKLLF